MSRSKFLTYNHEFGDIDPASLVLTVLIDALFLGIASTGADKSVQQSTKLSDVLVAEDDIVFLSGTDAPLQ